MSTSINNIKISAILDSNWKGKHKKIIAGQPISLYLIGSILNAFKNV